MTNEPGPFPSLQTSGIMNSIAMEKFPDLDPSKIPPGDFCYRIVPLRDGEKPIDDLARYGKDLREFSFRPGFKQVLCPYWQRTDYGTVKCLFTKQEVLDDEWHSCNESIALLAAHLASREKAEAFPRDWALPDEIKICLINEDDDDPCA